MSYARTKILAAKRTPPVVIVPPVPPGSQAGKFAMGLNIADF